MIKRLRAAWVYLRYMPLAVEHDQEDFWNESDGRNYLAFMNSVTGQKLRDRSGNLVLQCAVNATQASHKEMAKRCGWASGVAATFAWLDTHLPEDAGKETENEEDDFADRFRA